MKIINNIIAIFVVLVLGVPALGLFIWMLVNARNWFEIVAPLILICALFYIIYLINKSLK